MSEELKSTIKYLKNKNNTRRIKTITINEAHEVVEEIERLNNIIEEIREYVKHKIVECYDEGSTIGEFYKICDIDSKIEELLHKGENKE